MEAGIQTGRRAARKTWIRIIRKTSCTILEGDTQTSSALWRWGGRQLCRRPASWWWWWWWGRGRGQCGWLASSGPLTSATPYFPSSSCCSVSKIIAHYYQDAGWWKLLQLIVRKIKKFENNCRLWFCMERLGAVFGEDAGGLLMGCMHCRCIDAAKDAHDYVDLAFLHASNCPNACKDIFVKIVTSTILKRSPGYNLI